MSDVTIKNCPKCNTDKPISEYRRDKNTKDGYNRICRPCIKVQMKVWADANREKMRAYSIKHITANRDAVNARWRELYHERRVVYLAEHPIDEKPPKTDDKFCPKCDRWLSFALFTKDKHQPDGLTNSCTECRRSWFSAWYENPEIRRRDAEKGKEWNKANPEKVRRKEQAAKQKRRANKVNAGGHFTKDEFLALCERYEFRCLCCGGKFDRLTADHVKALAMGGDNFITNIQPLCFSCNSRKRCKHIDFRPDSPDYCYRDIPIHEE